MFPSVNIDQHMNHVKRCKQVSKYYRYIDVASNENQWQCDIHYNL